MRRLGLLLALGTVLGAPVPARAYTLAGSPWPSNTISYGVEARAYAPAVHRAARAWNRAGVGVRLRRAPLESADVVVRYGGRPCEGEALIGFVPRDVSDVRLGAGCRMRLITLTAVHEFGHVLGLGHEQRRCA